MTIEAIDRTGTRIAEAYDFDSAASAGEGLHRAFRPAIGIDYRMELRRILDEGAGLTHLVADSGVQALALWRVFHTSYCGRRFEIDDLVTTELSRSMGYGSTLLDFLERKARAMGCPTLTLNSGTQRTEAHRFYHRQRYSVIAFHFSKPLEPMSPP